MRAGFCRADRHHRPKSRSRTGISGKPALAFTGTWPCASAGRYRQHSGASKFSHGLADICKGTSCEVIAESAEHLERPTAIDYDRRPGHEAAEVGAHPKHGFRNLFRFSKATDWLEVDRL